MIFEKAVVNTYRGMMYSRCDDTESVKYFSAEDFEGLRIRRYSFKSSMGHNLSGYIYEYEAPREGRLVVFDHGFGGGHRAYMKEIELLARHGYRVFAYDHTGCMESGGDSPNGLSQSLCDLNDCLKAIKSDNEFAGVGISVIGHSWGAFSTMNIPALYPDLTHIVAISGFVSVEEMVKSFFFGILAGYRKAVMTLERESNPIFSGYDARETLMASDVKALLIYSDNDTLCQIKHYNILKEALSSRENITFHLEEGKGHNPNYTREAVEYLGRFSTARSKLLKRRGVGDEEKKKFVDSFDFEKMTEQDMAVWDKIFAHLES